MQTKRKPYILKFKNKEETYVYDVNTNFIAQLDPVAWDIIDELPSVESEEQLIEKFKTRHSPELIKSRYQSLKELNESHGFADSFRPKKVESIIKEEEAFKNYYKHGHKLMTLCVTERCNLRCNYCIYSEAYSYTHKTEHIDMDIATARRAVDWYFCGLADPAKDTEPWNEPCITFYGGEPLLNFSLIKDTVAYIYESYKDKKKGFGITTNLTILNDEMLRFLVEHNFNMLVSLDGPASVHDRHRMFPGGGGSYSAVERNLKRIMEFSPDYFRRKVSLNMVISPPYDYKAISAEVAGSPYFRDARSIRFNYVSSLNTSFYKQFTPEEIDDSDAVNQLFNTFRQLAKQGDLTPSNPAARFPYLFINNRLRSVYETLYNTKSFRLGDVYKRNNLCFPGFTRMFVSVKGEFYPCERVVEDYDSMCIGNVDDGLDLDKCYGLVQRYFQYTADDCKNCWAIRFCGGHCFSNWMDRSPVSLENKEKICRGLRGHYAKLLRELMDMKDNHPEAFKYIAKDAAAMTAQA